MTMKPLAEASIEAVRSGQIKIRPESANKMYFRWMESIHDWCLSRQLWWGHQIPMYYASVEGEADDRADTKRWFAGRNEAEAQEKAAKTFGDKKVTLVRDEDVLDTWFSSVLWPFSTLGWPKNQEGIDFQKLFPTSVLETGWDMYVGRLVCLLVYETIADIHDSIPFWVCRMIMLSLKMTGKIPFNEVFCHGLVRDNDGRKMSKSLGNGVVSF